MKRPLPVILSFLICGIFCGSLSLSLPWFLAAALFAFSYGIIFFAAFKIKPLILLPVFFVLGFIISTKANNFKNPYYDAYADMNVPVTISGKIVDINKNSITVKCNDGVKFYIYTTAEYNMSDSADLTGKIRTLSPKLNPADFDEIKYYSRQGVHYKMYEPEITVTSQNKDVRYQIWRLRTYLSNALSNMYSQENSGILRAMLLGDKTALSDDIKTLYRNAGIYHILAISGLHITLIASAFLLIFKKPRHGLIIIAALTAYCIFTGLSASSVRALLMMSTLTFGRMLERRYDIISSICLSAFIILIVNPLYLWDCGFLYSYSSVLGIALFADHFSKIFLFTKSRINKYVSTCLGTSLSAVITSKLVNMLFFYTFTIYDFIVNLFVLPVIGAVIGGGVISLVLYVLHIKLYSVFVCAVSFILNYYKLAAQTATSIPFCVITFGKPAIIFAVLYISAVIALKIALSYKIKAFYIFSALSLISGLGINTYINSFSELDFLYVGQGDGCCGFTNGITFTVDGGGTNADLSKADEGTYTLLPHLKYKGKTEIDYAFVSHIDNDHLKAIYEAVGNIKIKTVYLPKGNYTSELYEALLNKAEKYNVPIKYLKSGDKLTIAKDCHISVISPTDEILNSFDDVNNGSMVFKLTMENTTILFTGDITQNAEEMLLNRDISSDLIKIPHHGSKYSSSKEFLAKVNPAAAIISSGKNNIYNFPSKTVKDNLKELSIPYYNTADGGAIVVYPKNGKLYIKQ